MLAELEKQARRLGVAVRFETFDLRVLEGRGGLCWLRGRPVVVMDVGMPVVDKVGVLAAALARFDVESLCVPPLLRRRVQGKGRPKTSTPSGGPAKGPSKAPSQKPPRRPL